MRFWSLFLVTACAQQGPTRVFVAAADPPPPAPAQFVPRAPDVPDNCDDAVREYHELVTEGKGPQHPSVLAVKPVYELCISDSPPPELVRKHPQMPCGQAALERAALVAAGKGPNHPKLMAIEARLLECPNAKPSAEECVVVAREHALLQARGYGPHHPEMIASDAKRALCP